MKHPYMGRNASQYTTLDFRGERSIPIKFKPLATKRLYYLAAIPVSSIILFTACILLQDRFTVALAALGDGTKLPPFIIFKDERRDN